MKDLLKEFNIIAVKVETYKHIQEVQKNITLFIKRLLERSNKHDQSKLEEPECSIFGEFNDRLAEVEYGSEEYKQLLEQVRPAIDHHYSKNSHHPEFHKNGIEDMNLLDIAEMFCDWQAATKRNKNGNIRKSIEINAQRFNMSPQLIKILENTAKELFND
jgi:hypothetical protein